MAFEDYRSPLEDPDETERAKWVGVYIGILAVLLALCTMLGSNSTKDATRFNIDVSDTYNYYQAKNTRQMLLRNQAEHLEALLAANPALATEARQNIEKRIRDHRMWADRYESDPETHEGKKELLAKAKALEAARDVALRQDPYYDWAQALLQIAIVLGSVAIITGGRVVLLSSGLMGLIGLLLLVNGYLLVLRLPFLG